MDERSENITDLADYRQKKTDTPDPLLETVKIMTRLVDAVERLSDRLEALEGE
jgi:hypothetical protein